MSPSGNHKDCSVSDPVATASHSLSYRGLLWAQASLNPDADAVTIGCSSSKNPLNFPALVKVALQTDRPIACSVSESAVKSWPTSSRRVLERSLRGAGQLLDLVDKGGLPWAELEIGDQVHLFDPSGRERARVLRAFDKHGSRLALRCWDELGHEMVGDSSFTS